MEMSKKDYVKCPKKFLYDETDDLLKVYEMQEEFFKKGQFALGCIVQANVKLFSRGILDLPAAIIYTFDEYYDDKFEELEELSSKVFNLIHTKQENKILSEIDYNLEAETERLYGVRLPDEFTGGREVFFSAIMINRKYLPKKRLIGSVYPLNILRGRKPDAMLIPHWYW